MLRVTATLIDGLLAVVLAGLLAASTGRFFAERAVITFRIHSPDTWWNGPLPLVMGAISTFSYGLAFAVVLILLAEGAWGASAGKFICRRQVVAVDGRSAARRRWGRFLLKTSPWGLFCLALLTGRWELAVLSLGLAALAVVDVVLLPAHRRGLWYDRVAGTRVAARD